MKPAVSTMRATLFSLLMLLNAVAWAQETSDKSVEFANTITPAELKAHLEILASDEYEGRETGEKGQKMAAKYIADYFKSLGIPELPGGGYYQEVALEKVQQNGGSLTINGTAYEYLKDYYFMRGSNDTTLAQNEVVFAGFGINSDSYNDYDDLDVSGKVVMVLDEEPSSKKGIYYASGSKTKSAWGNRWRMKVKEATNQDAAALLIVVDNMPLKMAQIKQRVQKPSLQLADDKNDLRKKKKSSVPAAFISRDMANSILKAEGKDIDKLRKGIEKKGKPVSLSSAATVEMSFSTTRELVTAENVLAYIEGSDLKNELVVITAHYDHIGINSDGEINNGADDDGSGTVCALEIAEAFVKAKAAGFGPRRSVLVMTVSGEEKGLLGSEYYSEHPVFPLENTVVDLNIDMVGRKDPEHDDANYVYLIGSDKLSSELHEISEDANAEYTRLALDYTFNDPKDPNRYYYRSDHYNFAKNNIPVIFYFSGVHEDYHQPTDTVDKIMFEKTAVIARLVFHTAWQLANQNKRISVDVENDFAD